jgi:GT2 family glycosyltransferase
VTPVLPARLLEVEVAQPLPDVTCIDPQTGRTYSRVIVLVRLHSLPLGMVELQLAGTGLTADAAAQAIWSALGPQIVRHLVADGLPAATGLGPPGLQSHGDPSCLDGRQRLLGNAPFVSVVVATRERADSLATCLRSLSALAYPRFEVIVVDNAPTTTATANLVSRFSAVDPRVRYAREDRPGTSRARNQGVRLASGDIVAFTDDDATVDTHWLAALMHNFHIDRNVACVTGLILPSALETPAQILFEQFGGFAKGFSRRVYDLSLNKPADPLYPYTAGRFGSGPNMAFRKSVLCDIGGFDTALGGGTRALGGEDIATYFQVLRGGYQLVYEPAALVRHLHRETYASLRQQMFAYGSGVTAFLAKTVLDEPASAWDLLRKIPRGIAYTISPASAKNRNRTADYPLELAVAELRGMLSGPCAYALERWTERLFMRGGNNSHGSRPQSRGLSRPQPKTTSIQHCA